MTEAKFSIKKADNPCAVWDLTLWNPDLVQKDEMVQWLEQNAKKWVFQLERGEESGKLHYQGRFSLEKKDRWPSGVPKHWVGNMAPTSKNGSEKLWTYVMKEETRVDGPWMDCEKPTYVPQRLRNATLRGWQKRLFEELEKQDDRDIILVHDPVGGTGKTFALMYALVHKGAVYVPSTCDTVQQMAGALLCKMRRPDVRYPVIVDVPRATCLNPAKFAQVFAAVETWKAGYITDGRHHYREFLCEPPRMVVFYNRLPKGIKWDDLLSLNRIKFWSDFNDN